MVYPGVRRAQAGGVKRGGSVLLLLGGGVCRLSDFPTCRFVGFPTCWKVGKLAGWAEGSRRGAAGEMASAGGVGADGTGGRSQARRWDVWPRYGRWWCSAAGCCRAGGRQPVRGGGVGCERSGGGKERERVFGLPRGKTSGRAGGMNWNDTEAGCVRRSPLRGWVAVVQVAVYPGAG